VSRQGWIVAALLVASGAGAFLVNQSKSSAVTDPGGDAIYACEQAIPAHLKSGRADHFAREYASRFSTGFEVGGTVYATNSFGAVVSQDFTCQVAHDDREATFTVTSVTFP
jgi:hypothetical protein